MSELECQLKRIQEKIQQLLKEQLALQKEKQQLEKELCKCKDQSSLQKETIETLKQQVAVLKLSSGEMDETDKKEIEKRINTYIKEIDNCIVLLGE